MNHHLCLSVTFLDPLFHGKGDEDLEWPPSPMRLFQALLAGARTGCRGLEWNERRAEAFRWLAQLGPPLIIAPAARRSIPCKLFVPNNDSDSKVDRWARLTGKMAHPHRLVDGNTVHYVWALEASQANRSSAEILCREARNLLALGWGIDQVAGSGRVLTDTEVAALHGERWRAWNRRGPGVPTWRVPTSSSLEDLERVHQSFKRRIEGRRYHPPLKPTQFRTVEYLSTRTLPPRAYADYELPEGVAFRPESAAMVAALLRSLAGRMAKADTHPFPGGSAIYVAGHVDKQKETPPRFSYLPLPTIGHKHADGMIRRLLIAEPLGGDGMHAAWAQGRLRNATLRDRDGNDRGILLDRWRPASGAMLRRYVGQSRRWYSVTPVVLPGFDDQKQDKAERLLLTALVQADLPVEAVDEIGIRKAPFWPGSRHPNRYAVPAYLQHLPKWHVYLRFRVSVPGPLAIGAGRHAGLGLLAASDEESNRDDL